MTISRITLPQEFQDVTSVKLLKQPEPQYLHGRLLKLAMNAELGKLGELGLPIAGRELSTEGAEYTQQGDDALDLSQDPIMSEAVQVVVDFTKTNGDTIRLNRPKFTNTTYTQAARRVAVNSTITTTPVDVASEQTSITLDRFGGPYDSTNSRVAPFAVDEFYAKMPIHKLIDVVSLNMQRDFDRWLDAVGVALFDTTGTTSYTTGMAAGDVATAAENDFPLDYTSILQASKTLDVANVPVFPNGKRVLVITPTQAKQLADDAQFARYAQFHPEFNPLFKGTYWKSLPEFEIYKSNTLTTSGNTQYAQAFGPGMVGMGVGKKPWVATSTADNYGLLALVVWLFEAGFTVLDKRFGVSLLSA